MNYWRISATIWSLISFVLLLVSLATDYWVPGIFHRGLWKYCKGVSRCFPLGMDVSDYSHATRAFMLMATVAGAVSFFSLCFSFHYPRVGSVSLAVIVIIASVIAGVCATVATFTFTGEYNEGYVRRLNEQVNWSRVLGAVSGGLFFFTGWLAYKLRTKDRFEKREETVLPPSAAEVLKLDNINECSDTNN